MTQRAHDLVVTARGARFLGRDLPCATGRGGILPADVKREGDGATPAGHWRLTQLFIRPDRVAPPMTVLPVAPLLNPTGWAEDPADPAYNSEIRHPHAFPADRMRRGDGLYDLCAVTDHNAARRAGMGSAIFVHLWRRPRFPTAGCVAFARADLTWILSRWCHDSRLIITA
ncbi:MAG: L,D-transpeptidase family protein [Pseudomonadota bacterium]